MGESVCRFPAADVDQDKMLFGGGTVQPFDIRFAGNCGPRIAGIVGLENTAGEYVARIAKSHAISWRRKIDFVQSRDGEVSAGLPSDSTVASL